MLSLVETEYLAALREGGGSTKGVMNRLLFLFLFTLSSAFLIWQSPDSFEHMTHWTWFAHLLTYAYLIA
jgi:hypothetical protein